MCASKGCGSSRDAQSGAYSHVNRALLSSYSKIYHLRRNPRSLRSAVAQFIGLLLCHCEAGPERSEGTSRSNPEGESVGGKIELTPLYRERQKSF